MANLTAASRLLLNKICRRFKQYSVGTAIGSAQDVASRASDVAITASAAAVAAAAVAARASDVAITASATAAAALPKAGGTMTGLVQNFQGLFNLNTVSASATIPKSYYGGVIWCDVRVDPGSYTLTTPSSAVSWVGFMTYSDHPAGAATITLHTQGSETIATSGSGTCARLIGPNQSLFLMYVPPDGTASQGHWHPIIDNT
ncbi:MAG TPA: hypothetical protein VM238_18365 [Phycisphaerae bacterium]|nr:hypothetical protein [Phycisphaerae bacterium]